MNVRSTIVSMAATISGLSLASSTFGGAHTWRVNELFSNADGTIQFVELKECCGGAGETFVAGLQVKSQSAPGLAFTFPANLVGPTSNKTILLATAGFAALPGAPVPNHIIASNFFSPNGDTVSYHIYDTMTFTAGQLPTDCVNSLNDVGGTNVVGPNTPTNYTFPGGTPPSVDCDPKPICPGDIAPAGGDNTVNVQDLLAVIGAWGACGNPNNCPPDLAPAGGDDQVNVQDLLFVIGAWGACD